MALIAFVSGAITAATEDVPETAQHAFHLYPKDVSFSFDGPFGRWDQAELQRGYKVYKEVCSACHGLKFVSFRNLADLGYDESQVKAEAATWQVPGVDPRTGEAVMRAAEATDYFPSPYPNDVAAAAANNNAIPPDLSLIAKARHDGTPYVYSLLTGYQAVPQELVQEFPDAVPGPGLHYNPYFHSLALAMAPPLTSDGQVTYDDGTDPNIRADVARCGGVPRLDRGAQADRAQGHRVGGTGLRAVCDRACLSGEEAGLGRRETCAA